MSLVWIEENKIGYYRGPVCVGLIKGNTGWIFIDSGVEPEVPKKIIKALNDPDLKVSAVIATHAHADHIGGNKWLKENYGAVIYASSVEKPYIETPSFEPHYLFSAQAPKEMKNKFFEAQKSTVDIVIDFEGEGKGNLKTAGGIGAVAHKTVDGVDLSFINVSGHSQGMMGVLTSNQVFFCGDLLFTKTILEKHPMLFLHDLGMYLEALNWVQLQTFSHVILSHGGSSEHYLEDAQQTQKRLELNLQILLNALSQSKNEWDLHQEFAKKLGLDENFGGWHLNHGVLRAYLSYGLTNEWIGWEKGKYHKIGQ